MDMTKDSIPFPEPVKPDFSWTDEKILPEPEKVDVDFSWTGEGNYNAKENERNPHECKDELEKQWNDDLIPYTQENNSTKNVLKTASKNLIVQQVRTMMNQGHTPAIINERLAKTQKTEIISLFRKDIDKQLKMYGSVGRFVVDSRGYTDCAEAIQAASKNPYRKYMSHVIGCKCGTPRHVPIVSSSEGNIDSANSDGINSFLTEGKSNSTETVPVCPKTGVRILGGESDIDAQWAGNTMFDIINAASLDKEEGKKFTASSGSSYQILKRFFIAIDESAIPQEKMVEVPITEDSIPAEMQFETEGEAPRADVDLNTEDDDSISFIIPEKSVESPLDITRGVAPIEFKIEKIDPIEVELVQKDAIHSFVQDETPVYESIKVSLGDCDSEVEIGEDKSLDVSFDTEAKGGDDIVL